MKETFELPKRQLLEQKNHDSQFSFNTPEYPIKVNNEPTKHSLFEKKKEAGYLGENLAAPKGDVKKNRRVSFQGVKEEKSEGKLLNNEDTSFDRSSYR